MNTNAVIDVGLGLVLMYLMLSLACTMINEFVASLMQLRASLLSSSLVQLIDDKQVYATFQNHGLIETQRNAAGGKPSYLSSYAVATALIDSLDPNKPVALVSDVTEAAQKLPESNIRDTILLAATTAGNDLEKVRLEVAAWYDNAMDRVNGVYRRNLRWLSLGAGLALAVILNADTVSVAQALWRDGALRSEIVSMSDRLNPIDQSNFSQGMSNLSSVESGLRPFPLGWSEATSAWLKSPLGVVAKILGLLITALSVSLGAPFWFDLLSKFMNVRSAGTKPDRASASG